MADREQLLFTHFATAAETVARERPGVDLATAQELLHEAATVLHNGLVLDDLDDHDYALTVVALSTDLTATDPAAAVRERARLTQEDTTAFHDPATVAATHRAVAATLRL